MPREVRARQTSVLGRLRALVAGDVIEAVSVAEWPTRVTDANPRGETALAFHEAAREWADARDVSLKPAFEAHNCHSEYTGTDLRTTGLPVVCLALHDDGTLVDVYPHTSDDGVETVADGLALLESERAPSVPLRGGLAP